MLCYSIWQGCEQSRLLPNWERQTRDFTNYRLATPLRHLSKLTNREVKWFGNRSSINFISLSVAVKYIFGPDSKVSTLLIARLPLSQLAI